MTAPLVEPIPPRWRRRAGVAAAAGLGLVAIGGGMSAGLDTSGRWSNDAHAAVIPEVLYLEQEVAKVATIARVNGNIADEVTVDVRVDDLARRAAAGGADARATVATVMDAPDSTGTGSDHGDAAPRQGADHGVDDAPARTDESSPEPATAPRDRPVSAAPSDEATGPDAPAPGPANPAPDAPTAEQPAPPAPEPTDPAKGSGAPPPDRGRGSKDTKSASNGTKELAP